MIAIRDAKKIAAVGLGRSGIGASRLAVERGMEVIGLDEGAEAKLGSAIAALQAMGAAVEVGEAALAAAKAVECDLVVLSPGVPPTSGVLGIFRERGVPIVSELEFGYAFSKVPVVAITGTNGKTTTTALIAQIFCAAGMASVPCGNYGIPLSEVLTNGDEGDVLTVEVSSFQLEEIVSFRPKVAVWLNFAADHLDRYASLEEYYDAKARIFEFQTAEDVAVVRAGETVSSGSARVVTFHLDEGETAADYGYDGEWVVCGGEKLVRLADTKLRGTHNAENLMAAIAVTREFGVSLQAIREAVGAFQPPRHRCEYVATVGGSEWINDSKATNLHALESALRGQREKVVLIAGGKQKGLDYAPLAQLIEAKVSALVTIGEIGAQLVAQFADLTEAREAGSLEKAIPMAAAMAAKGQTILFSPGTSSFDQFTGYEARGDAFCQEVHQLAS